MQYFAEEHLHEEGSQPSNLAAMRWSHLPPGYPKKMLCSRYRVECLKEQFKMVIFILWFLYGLSAQKQMSVFLQVKLS